MLLLIIIVLLIFGFPSFGMYYGNGRYAAPGWGLGGLLLIILLLFLLFRSPHLMRF